MLATGRTRLDRLLHRPSSTHTAPPSSYIVPLPTPTVNESPRRNRPSQQRRFRQPSTPPLRNTPNTAQHLDIDSLAGIMGAVRTLLEEHGKILKRMDDRQANASAAQPIPQVPARSSSAWNPLLRSTEQRIQPDIDRWKNGLDSLLVFIGLFSAIVTAFVIGAFQNLRADTAAKTNELLTNMTDILLILNERNFSSLSLPYSQPFVRDASSVRTAAFWTISLSMSISVAGLAVACRSHLTSLTQTKSTDACSRLNEIMQRWETARRQLGLASELVPQVLVIPILLFVAGLMDSVLSLALPSDGPISSGLLSAATISIMNFFLVSSFLLYTVLHAIRHPSVSPFQSSLSHLISRILPLVTAKSKASKEPLPQRADGSLIGNTLDDSTMIVYHTALQETYDDSLLDQACGALRDVYVSDRTLRLADHEVNSWTFMLSPEASGRCNLTAAKTLASLYSASSLPLYTRRHRCDLTLALIEAANQLGSREGYLQLWESPFTEAIAKIYSTCENPSPEPSTYHPLSLFYVAHPISHSGPESEQLVAERSQIVSFVFELVTAQARHYSAINNDLPTLSQLPGAGIWAPPSEYASEMILQSLIHYHVRRDILVRDEFEEHFLSEMIKTICHVHSMAHVLDVLTKMVNQLDNSAPLLVVVNLLRVCTSAAFWIDEGSLPLASCLRLLHAFLSWHACKPVTNEYDITWWIIEEFMDGLAKKFRLSAPPDEDFGPNVPMWNKRLADRFLALALETGPERAKVIANFTLFESFCKKPTRMKASASHSRPLLSLPNVPLAAHLPENSWSIRGRGGVLDSPQPVFFGSWPQASSLPSFLPQIVSPRTLVSVKPLNRRDAEGRLIVANPSSHLAETLIRDSRVSALHPALRSRVSSVETLVDPDTLGGDASEAVSMYGTSTQTSTIIEARQPLTFCEALVSPASECLLRVHPPSMLNGRILTSPYNDPPLESDCPTSRVEAFEHASMLEQGVGVYPSFSPPPYTAK